MFNKKNAVPVTIFAVVILLIIAAVGCSPGQRRQQDNPPPPPPSNVTGTVFEDTNSNGVKDINEPGIPNILVSNGTNCTLTDQNGTYTISKTGTFVFVTVPNNYASSGPWYQSLALNQFNFGLKPAPGKNTDEFTFVHMTDIHLDLNTIKLLQKAVNEINALSPAFVISTGDLVNTGDTITISGAQANQWFNDYYKKEISKLNMPVYNAIGNHDVADIPLENAVGGQPGSSKNAYRANLGPTYYSFDWGQYHCLVLDPNELKNGSQVFEISTVQLKWLQENLSYRKGKPLLVFFHTPTTSWQSQNQVVNILKEHNTRIFAGHAHQNLLMNSHGIPEQVTAALSGEWGYGPNPDGSKPGYRIVSVKGQTVDSFYKEIDSQQQIEISLPGPIVNGEVNLVARIFSANGAVSETTYSIDNGQAVAMDLTVGPKWVTATASWNTATLSEGYYKITVVASDNSASFQAERTVKVSLNTTVTIQELQSNLKVYQGHYVTIRGTVKTALFNTFTQGAGGAVIEDPTAALIYAGECFSPPIPPIAIGDTISVKVIPLRFTWAFITATEDHESEYNLMSAQEIMMPSGQKEDNGNTKVARWFLRLVTGTDLTKL